MPQMPKFNFQHWLKGPMLRYMPGMITCEEFDGFIVDYLEDNLTSRQKTVFERHLRVCRECREYLAAYRRTMEVTSSLYRKDEESGLEAPPEDLIKAILDSREE